MFTQSYRAKTLRIVFLIKSYAYRSPYGISTSLKVNEVRNDYFDSAQLTLSTVLRQLH